MNRTERFENLQALAEKAFENHQLVKKEDRRWLLRKPGSGFCWVEILLLRAGRVFIHGDISPTLFGTYSGETEMGALNWIAHMHNDPGYAKEKARVGLDTAPVTVYDTDVARSDLNDLIERYEEDGCPFIDELRDIVGNDLTYQSDVQEAVYRVTEDAEILNFGECIAPRIVYAIYAVRKLLELLEEG